MDQNKTQEERVPTAEDAGAAVIVSPDTRRPNRVPPGQSRTRKWPILDAGGAPPITLERWKFSIGGLVANPKEWTWQEFQQLERVKVFADFHCVTHWSRLGNTWEGVSTRQLIELAGGARPAAEYVLARGYDAGFSTNLPLADFLAEDALVAFLHDGQPLTEEHGGPARLIVPQLYAWKSASGSRAWNCWIATRPDFGSGTDTTCMAIRGRKNVLAGNVSTGKISRNARLGQWAGAAQYARKAAPEYFKRYREERRCAVPPAPFTPHPKLWADNGLHAAWLGHSTVLLKIDGFTILTDPVLGARCGVRMGPVTVGLRRLVAPAVSRAQLPHIDLILLSHAHFDHFDLATLRSLERAGTAVVTAKYTSDLLRVPRYQSVQEVGWDQRVRVGPLSILGIRVKHWGARMRSDVHRGYNGYLIETARHRVVFGGDTALTDSFKVAKAKKPVDLAIMPIGAYDPWIYVHCNPEEAWRMGDDCGAEHLLPVHHQTFRLSREPYLEPVQRFLAAAGNHPDRVVTTRVGHEWSLG